MITLVVTLQKLLAHSIGFSCYHGRRQRGGRVGRDPPPSWIFKHGTNIVNRGLKVLFFGLFLLFFGLFSIVFIFIADTPDDPVTEIVCRV